MKVILYMAITVNGLIAKENDDASFVSPRSFKGYFDMVRKSGAAIIGRRTYEVMPRREFLKGCFYIVLTRRESLKKKSSNVIFTAKKPKEVLNFLKARGFKQVCLTGGSKLNAPFMKEKLIDEIYLDVEPAIFGKGIKLFADADFEVKLKLLGIKKFSRNGVKLHYKVLK